MKKTLTLAFIIATIALGAQNSKMKKTCIKMEKNEDGKVTKIDTCVTAATDEELQQKLNALGFGDDMPPLPPLPEIPEIPGVPPIPGEETTYTKVIIIDDGEEGTGSKKSSDNKKVRVVSKGGKSGKEVIVMNEDGHVMKTKSGSDPNVEIRTLKPGEKMDPEIEKMLKEQGIEMKDGKCEAKKIIIKNNENKNGKESSEVKVYVFSKMEVKKLSDEDKKQLPANASKAIQNAKPFDDLNVAPNPTDDACKISYRSTNKEPLQINVYDENGKTVYTETDKNVSEQINKTISLKELGKGIYFVHLTQGKQSEVRKVIVK